MKTGIIYSVSVYKRRAVIRGGQEATKSSEGGDASSSYNPPRDCNSSSCK